MDGTPHDQAQPLIAPLRDVRRLLREPLMDSSRRAEIFSWVRSVNAATSASAVNIIPATGSRISPGRCGVSGDQMSSRGRPKRKTAGREVTGETSQEKGKSEAGLIGESRDTGDAGNVDGGGAPDLLLTPRQHQRMVVRSGLPAHSDASSLSWEELQQSAPCLTSSSDLLSQSGVSTKSRSTKRSGSPTKSARVPADLRLISLPVRHVVLQNSADIPRDVRNLHMMSKKAQDGIGHIPVDVRGELEPLLGANDHQIYEHHLSSSAVSVDEDPSRRTRLVFELESLEEIRQSTVDCIELSHPEVVWNELVHSRLLHVALKSFADQDIRFLNITTADIHPDFVLRDALPAQSLPSGASLPSSSTGISSPSPGAGAMLPPIQSKRVDYAILLGGNRTVDHVEKLLRTTSSLSPITQMASSYTTINSSEQAALRFRPLAVSIETKAPDGAEGSGLTQLGIWVASHILRLRSLLGLAQVEVTLPLLLVVGGHWRLFYARDRGDYIEIMSTITVGDSSTITGCYKIVALLRALALWCVTVYRPWFTRRVLAGEGPGVLESILLGLGGV